MMMNHFCIYGHDFYAWMNYKNIEIFRTHNSNSNILWYGINCEIVDLLLLLYGCYDAFFCVCIVYTQTDHDKVNHVNLPSQAVFVLNWIEFEREKDEEKKSILHASIA